MSEHRSARRRSRSHGAATMLDARGVEVGRRLVEDRRAARRRRNARASPIRRRSPGDSGRPPSPTTRVVAARAARATKRVGAGEAPRPRAPRASERRAARAGCCRRRCRAAASGAGAPTRRAARQASIRQPARSTPPTRDRGRPSARASPSSSAATVLLPAPLSPTSATVSPGRELEVEPVEHERRAAPGRRTTTLLEPHAAPPRGSARRRRRPRAAAAGASSSASIRSATARPSALAWYSAPSRRSGRYSSGASTSTVRPACEPEAAVDQPHADRHRDERDAERRRQLEHRPRQEADAQRPHRRAAVALADRRRCAAACAAPRLNARSVGRPRTTSRKCVDSRAQRVPALAGALLGVRGRSAT